MPHDFDFNAQLRMSSDATASTDVCAVLLAEIPGAIGVERANDLDDRRGIDYWVTLLNGKRVAVDAKVRSKDRMLADGSGDDLALETWSVIEHQVVGWSRDPMKQTDYVLWLWKDTGRWRLVPFLMLCTAFSRRWVTWSKRYGAHTQTTARQNGTVYRSECVFVPTRTVWAAMHADNVRHAAARAAA